MKTRIEDCTSLTGWSGSAGVTAILNAIPDYIAESLAGSILIHFPAGSLGQTFSKAVTKDITGADEIVMTVWSRNKKAKQYQQPTDFAYTVKFAAGQEFCLPTFDGFDDVAFGVNGWTSVTEVTITALTNDEDWILISDILAVKDDYPLDLIDGLKAMIRKAADEVCQSVIPVGTVTCLSGDTAIGYLGAVYKYTDRFAVLKITDGINTEYHQIENYDEGTAKPLRFTSRYDGESMKFAYTAAQVSIWFPVEIGQYEAEAVIPGVVVWAMSPASAQNEADNLNIVDTVKLDGSGAVRRNVATEEYEILIDCEARHAKILALLGRCVRWGLNSNRVWVNGRKYDLNNFDQNYIEPTEAVEAIPKVQYTVKIQVREERALRVYLPSYAVYHLTVAPRIG